MTGQSLCPACRSPNRPGANFCASCGHSLTAGLAGPAEELPTRPRAAGGEDTDTPTVPWVSVTGPSLDLRVGRRTHTGRTRDLNEDSFLTLDLVWSNKSTARPAGLFVVADGMGGHEGGELASGLLIAAIARRATSEWLSRVLARGETLRDAGEWLVAAIQGGNEEIYSRAQKLGYDMGTTVVAALVIGDRAHIAHVGDSRAYRINGEGIERLTIDHSIVESLVVSNQITREEAREHPQANVIYRTVGDRRQVSVDLNAVQLSPGDTLLLCSDGLSGMVSDEEIARVVRECESPQVACDTLVDAANSAGGEDNITAVLVQLVEAT